MGPRKIFTLFFVTILTLFSSTAITTQTAIAFDRQILLQPQPALIYSNITYTCPSGPIKVQAQMLAINLTPAPQEWEVLQTGGKKSNQHDATFSHLNLTDYRADTVSFWNIQCFYHATVPLDEVVASSLVNLANAHLNKVWGSFRRKVYTDGMCVKSGENKVVCKEPFRPKKEQLRLR
jgi:hypothetical protein